MSHKHKTKIEKIFEHPVCVNIDVKRLLPALEHYGATVEMTKHNKARITIKGEEFLLAFAIGHDLSKDEIVRLRHYLQNVGLSPDKL